MQKIGSKTGFRRKQSHSRVQAKKVVNEDIVCDVEDEEQVVDGNRSAARMHAATPAEINGISDRLWLPGGPGSNSNYLHSNFKAYSVGGVGRQSYNSMSTYHQYHQ